MRKFTLTPEERRARLEGAHAAMTAAVEALSTGDEWQAFLAFSAKLHAYSASNRMWLFAQSQRRGWDDLGHVAGFRTWLSLGRHVRKGETGLTVLAPVRVKIDDGEHEASWAVRGFKVEHVFADCQTDGDGEIPALIRPELLNGAGPEGGWNALASIVDARGFALERGPLAPANGETRFAGAKVVVADRLEEAAAVKTLAHELAHVLLHAPEQVDYHSNRARCEVEAESVAYLVCSALGLVTDSYSFPYVATWANGSAKVVTAAADVAIKCADQILALVEERELIAA